MARHRTAPVDDVPEAEWIIHERLLDWSRWCRANHRPGHAMSAEGRRPSAISGSAPRGSPSDATNAALLLLSPDHRRALQLRYFSAMPDRVICRMLKLRASSYARFISDARRLLKASLQD